MLSMHKIKQVLNPVHSAEPEDDFRLLDSWTENEDGETSKDSRMKYLCYKIMTMDPETGKKNVLYKAVKFARVTRLPKSAKQSTSFMDMQSQVLSAVYEQGYNMVTVIANVIRPTPEGLMFLYGVQGVSDDIDEAKRRADLDFRGFLGSMMGTFRVLHIREVTVEEGAWLEEKMRGMKFLTCVRGIPKANTEGEDMGNKGVGGTNLNPDSQGTLEEIITAMADSEYVIEILSTPVYQRTLMSWQSQTEKQMTEWYGQLQGTKSLSFNLSIPMTYMTSTGNSHGWSKNYTDSRTVSYTQGESFSRSYGENVGNSISQSLSESFGLSKGHSLTNSVGENMSISSGVSRGQTVGETQGISHSSSFGETVGHTTSQGVGYSQGVSKGTSSGITLGNSQGNNTGQSYNNSTGNSYSQNFGSGSSRNFGSSNNSSFGQSQNQSISSGASRNSSFGQSSNESISQGNSENHSLGQSMNKSWSQGASSNESYGQSSNSSVSNGTSKNESMGESVNQSTSHGTSSNESFGTSTSESSSHGTSSNESFGESSNQSTSHGTNQSQSFGQSASSTESTGTSHGASDSYGTSAGTGGSHSDGTSSSSSNSHSSSTNSGWTESHGASTGAGYNHNDSHTDSSGGGIGGSLGGSLAGFGFNASGNRSTSTGYGDGYSGNAGFTDSYGETSSKGTSDGYSNSSGENHSNGVSWNEGSSHSSGTSDSASHSSSLGASASESQSSGFSDSTSMGSGTSHSTGTGFSDSTSSGSGTSHSQGTGFSDSTSTGSGTSHSLGYGSSQSTSTGSGTSHSTGYGTSSSSSEGSGTSQSDGYGLSESFSQGQGSSYSSGYGSSTSNSNGYGNSYSEGFGTSMSSGTNMSISSGNGSSRSSGEGTSAGQSISVSVSQNKGTSYSSSMSQSVNASASDSYSQSTSQGVGDSYSQSMSSSASQSQSTSQGQSRTRSLGESDSESYTQSISNGVGKSWGQSTGISQGQSYGSSEGTSQGTSIGNTGSVTTGTSGSMGLGPSIGYSKSYQWMDQQVKDILELLEYQNERLKKALRGNGAFYTYVYIACQDLDALATAQASAKSTWQNTYALTQPIQVLDLSAEEQEHLLYHFRAFSADVTREMVGGVSDYKYCTVLLPDEYVAYTHLPRVSEGGIDTGVDDVPKFRVPGLMRGDIYMGTQLNAERYTLRNGYRTQFDYRINIDELMHGMFVGQSRSGKTVAAMRFVRELANARRTETGKRLRIVIMDPKQDWRGIARFVEPERFRFYSMGNTHFRPINLNPCKIPYGVEPQHWIDGIINIYCRAYGLLERGKQMLSDVFYSLYSEQGIFDENEAKKFGGPESDDWKKEVSRRSGSVTFHKVYKQMASKKDSYNGKDNRAGSDTMDAYSRLCERLSCFSRPYSIEYRLFSAEDKFDDPNSVGTGCGVDELIGDDDVTVFESFGLESTFANFIFGIITSGFYKVAKSYERGYLNPAQYETVLVIEEANKVLTGNDTAGAGGGQQASLSGQSEFEEILDQSAGYGLFILAITQKPSMMPSSIIANCGLLFMGRLTTPDDVNLGVRMIGREERIEDRDIVKWLPKSPTGWFICRSSRGYSFIDAEPVLVQIEPLNNATISNAELNDILVKKEMSNVFTSQPLKKRKSA